MPVLLNIIMSWYDKWRQSSHTASVDAHHSLRLSVGWNTTDADIDRLAEHLPAVIAGLRALRTG